MIASNIAEELYKPAKQALFTSRTCANAIFNAISFGIEATEASSSFPFLTAQKIKLSSCHNLLQLFKDSHVKN